MARLPLRISSPKQGDDLKLKYSSLHNLPSRKMLNDGHKQGFRSSSFKSGPMLVTAPDTGKVKNSGLSPSELSL